MDMQIQVLDVDEDLDEPRKTEVRDRLRALDSVVSAVRLAAACFALVLGLWMPGPAASHDIVAAEMMPIDDEVAQHTEAIAEIKRQGQSRVTQISRWIEWWTKIEALATATSDRMKKNFDERIANAEKAQGLLAQLYVEKPEDSRHLPHFGWRNAASMAKLINSLREEAANWTKLIADGKANWHIAAVGWITGEGIQKVIDDKQNRIRDINQKLGDGTLDVHIAGYGWINEKRLRSAIEGLEKRKEEIRQKISAGDYDRRGMEGAKRRAEEPAVATRAPAEQADPKERRSEDGARHRGVKSFVGAMARRVVPRRGGRRTCRGPLATRREGEGARGTWMSRCASRAPRRAWSPSRDWGSGRARRSKPRSPRLRPSFSTAEISLPAARCRSGGRLSIGRR